MKAENQKDQAIELYRSACFNIGAAFQTLRNPEASPRKGFEEELMEKGVSEYEKAQSILSSIGYFENKYN